MSLTLHNATGHLAHFELRLGELYLTQRLTLEPDRRLPVELLPFFEISASTLVDEERYHSTSTRFESACTSLTAQLRQGEAPGEYHFELVQRPGHDFDTLSLEKTCNTPVIFQIGRARLPHQTVVLEKSLQAARIHIGHSITVGAIVNGITTPTVDADATLHNVTVTLINETPEQEPGFYQFIVS